MVCRHIITVKGTYPGMSAHHHSLIRSTYPGMSAHHHSLIRRATYPIEIITAPLGMPNNLFKC